MEYAILFLPLIGSLIGYLGRSFTKYFSEIFTTLFVSVSSALSNIVFWNGIQNDTYGNYKGMQVILNDLQNIVTDIESYHAKTKEKLQNVFNKVGKVETEDGLSVGGFLAPAIESAFNKDSRHLGGNRLMKGVDMPKVQFLPKDIETPQNEESPKQTIFAPVKRYF